MQVSTNEIENNFKPIDLTITIESEIELKILWSLFNNANAHNTFKGANDKVILTEKEIWDHPIDDDIWEVLNSLMEERQLIH